MIRKLFKSVSVISRVQVQSNNFRLHPGNEFQKQLKPKCKCNRNGTKFPKSNNGTRITQIPCKNYLEGTEPPLTLRQENHCLYFGHFSPVRQGLFPCSTALFLKNSHRTGPVLQEFGFVLRAGIWHSTSVVQALPWG